MAQHVGRKVLMQRFTLLHDSSRYGWQAAYLAFHLSARLGAPLLVLLVEPAIDRELIAQRATQVEVGGRAAGLEIKTGLVQSFSVEAVADHAAVSNGLIVPRQLVQDELLLARFLDTLSCPLWVVTKESEMRKMAVLASNVTTEDSLVTQAASLANRLQVPLVGLARQETFAALTQRYRAISWHRIPDFSPVKITGALSELDVEILFLSVSDLSMAIQLPVNCVICPA